MKNLRFTFALFVLLPCVVVGADLSPTAFPEVKIALKPLSLLGGAKLDPLTILHEAVTWFQAPTPPPATVKRVLSHMPIVTPSGEVDRHMPIKTPDSSVDYKLIVKAPDLESVK